MTTLVALRAGLKTPNSDSLVNRVHMPFELDRGIAHRARINLIVLATDHTLEYEYRKDL